MGVCFQERVFSLSPQILLPFTCSASWTGGCVQVKVRMWKILYDRHQREERGHQFGRMPGEKGLSLRAPLCIHFLPHLFPFGLQLLYFLTSRKQWGVWKEGAEGAEEHLCGFEALQDHGGAERPKEPLICWVLGCHASGVAVTQAGPLLYAKHCAKYLGSVFLWSETM